MDQLSNDLQKLTVSGIVTLYELDASNLGLDIMRFHGHTAYEDWARIYEWAGSNDLAGATNDLAGHDYDVSDTEKEVKQDIIWQGEVYSPMALKSDGLEVRGDGKASTPTLRMANVLNGIQGGLSALCLQYDDLAGSRLRVITTLAKYLDSDNFSDGNPQASDEHKKQLWYLEQKTSESNSVITFELSNPVDFEGQRIPCREITSYCHWAAHGRYRGAECQYRGTAMYDEFDNPTDDPAKDKCSGTLRACKLRFGENNPLSFGGFPNSNIGS